MARQGLVEFPGNVVHGMQPRPGNGREIVVLVVQADVVREDVEGPIIRKGLGDGDLVVRVALGGRDGLVDVVLGDEVAGEGVQAASQKGGEQQVEEGVGGGVGDEEGVEGELDDDVEEVHPGEGDAVDGHGADGVEEDLERAEEGLAEDGVEEEGLDGGGEVRVEAVYAEGLVVGEMIWLSKSVSRYYSPSPDVQVSTNPKGSTVGNANGQIGNNGEQPVGERAPKGQVVRNLVDGQEQVLVRRGAKDVRDGPELPGPEWRGPQHVGEEDLQADDAGDDVLGQGFGAAELEDLSWVLGWSAIVCWIVLREEEDMGISCLGMGLDDGKAPRAVRLFGVRPEEVMLLVVCRSRGRGRGRGGRRFGLFDGRCRG